MYSFWTIPNSKKEIFFTKFADANVTKLVFQIILIKTSHLWFTLWPKCDIFLIVKCIAARISLNWVLLYKIISWKFGFLCLLSLVIFTPECENFTTNIMYYITSYYVICDDMMKIPEICLLITYFKFQTPTPYVFVALVWLCPSNDRNKLVNT